MTTTVPHWDPRPCGLSVRTDSLTVFIDLSRVPLPVAEALRRTLNILEAPNGDPLPSSDNATVQRAAHQEFSNLFDVNPSFSFQYSTILSAFFHESRHVHDMRATRTGAELLLKEFQVYAGTEKTLSRLSEWLRDDRNRRIKIPLSQSIAEYQSDATFPSRYLGKSIEQARKVANWWNARSSLRTLPGTSIREIFETLGFVTQIEWVRDTFGPSVANEIAEKTLGKEPLSSPYLRPVSTLINFCRARGVAFDPEPHDVLTLLFESLNVNGLDEAFHGSRPTKYHPGAWFDRFADYYSYAATKRNISPEQRASAAVHFALKSEHYADLGARVKVANAKISDLQDRLLREMTSEVLDDSGRDEHALLLTEVGIDFRDMQRIVSEDNAYFIPSGYVDRLLRGELHSVFTRVQLDSGEIGDFRTASHIPGNHVGGVRRASQSSQEARLLISGRDLKGDSFYEDFVFRNLTGEYPDGHGLKFRLVHGSSS